VDDDVALTDAAGVVQTQYTYEPFGATAITGLSDANAFQYTGRENDGTGLYYYRARYYHAVFGRFVTQDPIAFAGGDVNLYAYVRNNPLLYVDSSGLRLDLSQAGSLVGPLQRTRQTPRGAAIFDRLEQLQATYSIVEGTGSQPSHYNPATKTIVVNPTLAEPICTTAGRKPASSERKLAHEGGHALGYPGDSEQFEMNNIRRNENPVATALGQPERTTYDPNRCR